MSPKFQSQIPNRFADMERPCAQKTDKQAPERPTRLDLLGLQMIKDYRILHYQSQKPNFRFFFLVHFTAFPDPLHPDIIKNIRPIYEALSDEDLLTRCFGGHTQNSNESSNSTIWRLAPKHLNAGSKIIEIASFIAACVFTERFSSTLKMMNDLNINLGSHALNFASGYDEQRVSRQDRRSFDSIKEARKEELLAQNKFYEEVEGLMYGAGIAD